MQDVKKVHDEEDGGRQRRPADRLASLNIDHRQALNREAMSYFVFHSEMLAREEKIKAATSLEGKNWKGKVVKGLEQRSEGIGDLEVWKKPAGR